MATIRTLIDEFRTIATASTAIAYFDYWDDNVENSKRAKDYPALFIDRQVEVAAIDMVSNKTTYRVVFTFADLFHRGAETNTHVNEDAQLDLETIYFQFWNEFKDRTQTTNASSFQVPDFAGGNYAFKQFNERLNTLVVTLEFVMPISCNPGTFNYDS